MLENGTRHLECHPMKVLIESNEMDGSWACKTIILILPKPSVSRVPPNYWEGLGPSGPQVNQSLDRSLALDWTYH